MFALAFVVSCLPAVQGAAAKHTAEDVLAAHAFAQPLAKLALEDFLEAAFELGLCADLSPKQPLAREFLALKAKCLGLPQSFELLQPVAQAAPEFGATKGTDVLEREPNDTLGWADSLGCGQAYQGAITFAYERDAVRLSVSEPAILTAATSGAGADPLNDTTLTLVDAHGGLVAFDDDSGPELFSLLRATVLPGEYTLYVGAFGDLVGGYRATVSCASAAVSAFTPGAAVAGSVPANALLRAYTLDLAQARHLKLRCDGTGAFDPILWLRNASGGGIAANDDASGVDSELELQLPAGSYQVWVSGFNGTTGSYQLLTLTDEPATLPNLCGASTSASFASLHDYDCFALESSGAGLHGLTLTSAPGGGANDTVLALFDRDFRFIAQADDSLGLFAQITLPLPAGTYYALAFAYPLGGALGGYTLSASCGAPEISTEPGCSALASPQLVSPGQALAYTLSSGTAVPVELRTNNANFAPNELDSVLVLLDAQGRVLDFNDDSDSLFNSTVGAQVAAGQVHAVLYGYLNAAVGQTELVRSCPLNLIGTPQLGASFLHLSYAKAGELVLGLGSQAPGSVALPPIQGNCLLDPGLAVLLGYYVMPAAGQRIVELRVPEQSQLAGVPYWFQNVQLSAPTASGWFGNQIGIQFLP